LAHWEDGGLSMKSIALLLAVLSSASCITGPTCVSRQRSGSVEPIAGTVWAGEVASHVIRYATDGSQNNLEISWRGMRLPDGPRLVLYVTRASCAAFDMSATLENDDCHVLARSGWSDGAIATTAIVTHGRGNPEILGTPPTYKVWIIGDSRQDADYTIDISWFFGPDC
jgi:hypothetical protein